MSPVSTPEALAEAIDAWPAGMPLAIDTEFVRERTYFPKLCLVQVAAPDGPMLVDMLAIPDGGALVAALLDRGRAKQLHAARQDLESLLPLTGGPPGPVFDTQLAAALLGHPAQVGYADLVRELLGIELAKGHARTDWSRRPLSPEQLAYAADDVRYLPPLVAALEERLEAAGRRDWMTQESKALEDVALYRVEPAEAWRRLKGLERMDAATFAAAVALARWREERAIDRDLPRGWVLPDAAIHELAASRPRDRAALARIGSVPKGTAERAGAQILAAIEGAADPGVAPPPEQARPGPAQVRQLKSLQQRLAGLAAELGIQPEVLATRRELAALVRGERTLPVLSGWRRDVVGEVLLAAL